MSIAAAADRIIKVKNMKFLVGWLLSVLLSLIVLTAFSMVPWYIVVVWVLAISALVIFLFKFEWGLYTIIFLIPLEGGVRFAFRIDSVHGQMIDFIGKYLGIMISSPVVLFSFFGFLLAKWAKVRKLSSENPLLAPAIILFIYACFSLLYDVPLIYSGIHLLDLVLGLFLYTMIIHAVSDERTHRRWMWLLLLAGVFHALLEIASFFIGGVHAAYDIRYPIMEGVTFVSRIEVGYQYMEAVLPRRAGFLTPSADTALFMIMCITVAVGLLLTEKRTYQRVIAAIVIPLFIAINLLAQSMGGVGTLFLSVLFLAGGVQRLRKYFIAIVTSFLIFSIFTIQFESSVLNSLLNKETTSRVVSQGKLKKNDTGLNTRLWMWKSSLVQMKKNNAQLTGLGMGSVPYYVRMPHAHSIYASTLIDFGLMGFFILFWVMVILAKRFRGLLSAQDSYARMMSMITAVMLVAFGIYGIVDFSYLRLLLWFNLALFVAVTNLARQEQRQSVRQSAAIG